MLTSAHSQLDSYKRTRALSSQQTSTTASTLLHPCVAVTSYVRLEPHQVDSEKIVDTLDNGVDLLGEEGIAQADKHTLVLLSCKILARSKDEVLKERLREFAQGIAGFPSSV